MHQRSTSHGRQDEWVARVAPRSVNGGSAIARLVSLIPTAVLAFALSLACAGSLCFVSAASASPRSRVLESAFPSGAFEHPTGVAVDQATGNVFVADSEAGTVDIVGAEGGAPAGGVVSPISGFEFGSQNEPEEVAVDNACYFQKLSGSACEAADPANGDVYVTESPGHAIIRLKLNATTHEYEKEIFVEPLQENEEHEDLPIEPNGVAVDSHGDVYIANYKARAITVYDPAGAKVGEVAQTLIEHPAFLAIGAPGVLYVGNYGGGVAKIEVNGSFAVEHEEMLPVRSGGPSEPEGRAVAVDSEGNVLVDEGSRIVVYSSAGAITEEFGTGEFEESRGVAVNDETHNAYVTNPAATDLEAFAPASEGAAWVTGSVTAVGVTSATLNGTVNPEGHTVSACEFEYGTTSSYGHSAPCKQSAVEIGEGTTPKPVSAELAALEPGTTYHYRITGTNTKGPGHGGEQTFTTMVAVHGVKTEGPIHIGITEATVQGTIEPDGSEIEYYFEYGTTTASSTKSATATVTGAPDEKKTVTATLKGLTGGEEYHYKLVAKNELYAQLVAGAEERFTTLQPIAAIETGGASEVSATSAKLNGAFTANEEKPEYEETEYYFEYATGPLDGAGSHTQALTISRAEVEAHPGAPFPVSASVTGLPVEPGATAYHYRLVTHDALGASYGGEETFTTRPVFSLLTTGAAAPVGPISAMLHGTFQSVEGRETTYSLEYKACTKGSSSCTPWIRTTEESLSEAQIKAAEEASHGAGVDVATEITGLEPGTAYHDRLVATSDFVTVAAGEASFTTGPQTPVVDAEEATEVTATGALLAATIEPGNSTTSIYPTTYYFEYERAGLGSVEMFAPAGTSAGSGAVAIVPEKVTGLTPDVEYTYWLVTENVTGRIQGLHQIFTTAAEPPAETPPAAGSSPSASSGLSQPAALPLLPSLVPVPIPKAPTHLTPPKPVTRAQKLARALKSCKQDKKKPKRESCEKQARSKYAPTRKSKQDEKKGKK
jgi:DNA-binding beta-propeller fold protein YncE